MSVVKIKLIATCTIEVDPDNAIDYDDLEDYFPDNIEGIEVAPTIIAIAMVKSDIEDDSLPLDEFEWDVTEMEVVK